MEKFTFFESYYRAAEDLSQEQKLTFYNAIFAYMFDDIEPDFTEQFLIFAWKLILPNLDKTKKLSKSGKKGREKQLNDETPTGTPTTPPRGSDTTPTGVLKTPVGTPFLGIGIGKGKKEINKEKKSCPKCGDAIVQKNDGSFVCFACHWEGSLTE